MQWTWVGDSRYGENAKALMDTATIDGHLLLDRFEAIDDMRVAEHRLVYETHDEMPHGLRVEIAVWRVKAGSPFFLVPVLSWSYAVANPDYDFDKPYGMDNLWATMAAGDRYIIEGDMSNLVEIGEAKWEELQRTKPWEGRT